LARKSLPARVGDKTRPDKKKESGGSTRATIREVAKRASVSLTTVSRVINNAVAVRPAVRASVIQAMDELGYVPDAIAQSLRTQSTMTVG